MAAPVTYSTSEQLAYDLYEAYEAVGAFPLYWQRYKIKRADLIAIFAFFSRLEAQLIQTPEKLVHLLHNRLVARRNGQPIPWHSGYDVVIDHCSMLQLQDLQALGGLVKPAFELFVTGALNPRRKQHFPPASSHKRIEMTATTDALRLERLIEYPEPNSGIFFYWAEFAILAASAGYDSDVWIEQLKILLRAEKLFALCYGGSVNGMISPERNFSDYTNVAPTLFQQLSPETAQKIPYPTGYRFDELEREATDLTLFAFPGGIT